MNAIQSLVNEKKAANAKPKTVLEAMAPTAMQRITPELAATWLKPDFQRPVINTKKVNEFAEELKHNGGKLSGVIILGLLDGKLYKVDAQHRLMSFKLSGLLECWGYVVVMQFDSMGAMGEEYTRLSDALNRQKPDDVLRAKEGSNTALALLRELCPFIGYGNAHASGKITLSMSKAIRTWFSARPATPRSGGVSARDMAKIITAEDAEVAAGFFQACFRAWGKKPDYMRLWGTLNMTVCAWLYQRVVLGDVQGYSTDRLSSNQFKRCLMTLSADPDFSDWLQRRTLSDHERGHCYNTVKRLMLRRVKDDTGKKIVLPQPAWAPVK